MWTNHNLFNQSPIDGHEDCFNSFAISNSASMNNPVCFQNVINLDLGKAELARTVERIVLERTVSAQSPQVSLLCSEACHA